MFSGSFSMYEHIYEMVSAGRCILAENQDSNVIRQQGEAVADARIGHRKIIVTQEFTVRYESAKHLGDVARERTLPSFCFFSLVPLSLSPSLCTMAHFPISLRAPFCHDSRLTHAKIQEIKSLLSGDQLP